MFSSNNATSLLGLYGLISFAAPEAVNDTSPLLVPRTPRCANVIVQMFEWTWDSVAAECTGFLGPAGYGYVQVSPPQEHIQGSQWYTDYQPVSYILQNKRGNRNQFANMISTCHAAGVRVISDTLFNHMAGIDSGVGVAGSPFTHYSYPGIYQYSNFHHCGLEPNDNIVNYDNRLEVQTCQLVGLADLATDTDYVRARLAQYADDVISLGVDGLRLDAAKHMAATDIANILSRLQVQPQYITQEVIFGGGEPIMPSEYIGNGDVQEFRYTVAVKQAFSGGSLTSLQNLDSNGWVPGTQANVFVANHDTERNGNSLNYNSPSNTYVNAMIFSLAHPYGTPSILSSYSFSSTDQGAPNGGAGICTATGGSNGWLCQHRFPAVSGMVGFRNNVGSANMTGFVSPQGSQIAFGRGSSGYVAINNADSVWTTTFSTLLPGAVYCDVISGAFNPSTGACTGTSFLVSGGSLRMSVAARSAVAIHTGAINTVAFTSSSSSSSSSRSSSTSSSSSSASSSSSSSRTSTSTSTSSSPAPSGSVSVSFSETAQTNYGENIFLVGSLSQLASWTPANAIPLSSASYPVWTVTVNLPASTSFQYKFIRKSSSGQVTWESDPNRQATTPTSGTQSLVSTFR